jgi:hypothetical protein
MSQDRRDVARGPDEQPQQRWYPANLSELLYIVTKELPKTPGPEGRVCGSHWGISKAAVSHGHMIETATPVHEDGDDQAAPRLNKPLYEVIPAHVAGCWTRSCDIRQGRPP